LIAASIFVIDDLNRAWFLELNEAGLSAMKSVSDLGQRIKSD
jgi:hypothetical protein